MYGRILLGLAFLVAVAIGGAACSRDAEIVKQEYLRNGDRFFAEKNYQAAIVEYRNAVKQDPKFGRARHRLAQAYLQVDDKSRALAEFVRAADLLPTDLVAQLDAARVLIRSGQLQDGKTRAELALKLDPKNADAHMLLGSAAANLKEFEDARQAFEDGLAAEPGRSDLHVNLGLFRRFQGNPQEAEASFKQALALGPKTPDAHLALANLYWAMGRTSDAERALEDAVKLAPTNTTANRSLAMFYIAMNRPSDAEAPLRRAADVPDDTQSKLVLADYYISRGRYTDAQSLLDTLVNASTTLGPATVRRATIEYQLGHREQAQAILDAALAKVPDSVEMLVAKGQFHLTDEKPELALGAAEAALKINSQSWEAYELLGTVQAELRHVDEATKTLSEAIRLNPRAVTAQIVLSRMSLEQGKFQNAVRFAEEALQLQPGSDAARYALVRALVTAGDARRARTEIQPLERLSESAEVHALLGQAELGRGDLAEARKAFEKAAALDPTSVEAVGGLISLDTVSKQVPRALKRAEDLVKAAPTSADALYLAARTLTMAGDLARAEEAVRKAIDLDPSLRPAYDLLSRLYREQNKLDQAQQTFERVVQRRPNDVPAHTMIGILLEAQGKREEAKRAYEKVLSVDPQAALAANNLAYIYAEEDANLDLALNLAQTAKAGLPDDPDVNDTLGWIFYKRNLTKQAIEMLELSVRKNPEHVLYQYHIGLAYLRAGETAKARAALERALKLQPDFKGAVEAKKALASLSS